MITQALPKTQELTDRINTFLSKRRCLNLFESNSLKRDAEKLKGKIDDVDYYDFLGQISALENNRKSLLEYYEYSLQLQPDYYRVNYDYAAFLANSGLIFKSEKQSELLFEKFSDDSNALDIIIGTSYQTCKFQKTLSLLKKQETRNNFQFYDLLIKSLTIFESAKLNDDEAQRLCQLAYSVLETKNLYFSGSNIEIIGDCVLYTIYVDLPIEEIFEVNWELAGVFVENVENTRSDVLMFEYSSVDVLEEKEKHERLI